MRQCGRESRRRLLCGAIAAGLVSGVFWAAAAAAEKIAVVDVQQVLAQSKRGQAAKAKLDAEVKQREQEVAAEETDIKRLQEELKRQAPVLSRAALQERQASLGKRVADLQRTVTDLNQDLARREDEALQALYREIVAVIDAYGRDQGYNLVLGKAPGATLYNDAAIDITQEIIRRFDGQAK